MRENRQYPTWINLVLSGDPCPTDAHRHIRDLLRDFLAVLEQQGFHIEHAGLVVNAEVFDLTSRTRGGFDSE
jgi:hypothetical protein